MGNFLLPVWNRRKGILLITEHHGRPVRPTPLTSVQPIALSAIVVECDGFVFLFICMYIYVYIYIMSFCLLQNPTHVCRMLLPINLTIVLTKAADRPEVQEFSESFNTQTHKNPTILIKEAGIRVSCYTSTTI